MRRYRETLAFVLLLTLGQVPRLAMISRFPSIPVSDFRNLVIFGMALHNNGIASRGLPGFWEGFNIGLPLVLCGLFKIFPHADPDGLARLATAFVNGLLPVLPFLIWRGALSFRVRMLAGAALALWPGQILFSGVVAQDNWVLFPAVALGALAVRSLADERAWPVTAGLLYGVGVAMRADMLLMLLPLWLAAVGLFSGKLLARSGGDKGRASVPLGRRRVVAGCLAAGIVLLGLAEYRHATSGRFSLTPEFVGVTTLGAYLPGASGVGGWEPPYAFISSVRPDLLRDRKAMLMEASRLAVREALRRPGFHALRIASMLGFFAMDGDSVNLRGSLEAPDVLPAGLHERGAALAARLKQPLRIELSAIQALFLAALIVGVRRRNRAVLVLASAVVLKYGLHAFGVFQGRYLVVATALEILAIAVAVEEVLRPLQDQRLLLRRALAAGAVFGLGLLILTPRLMAFVEARDIDTQQRTYHFLLEAPGTWHATTPANQYTELACTVDRGSLVEYWPLSSATIRLLRREPAPGDTATAVCELSGAGKPRPLVLQVFDSYGPGGLPGRVVQRVEVDGAEVLQHDIAEAPWVGYTTIPLGNVGMGTKRRVAIEVKAVNPIPGEDWGFVALAKFQLARSSPAMNLALHKPAAQSSTYPEGVGAGPGSAVDGNTDGMFYDNSVTATNPDANAWWEVDLGGSAPLDSIVIWNRTDCCGERLEDYWVFVSETPFDPGDTPARLKSRAGVWSSHRTEAPHPSVKIAAAGAQGRYVRVQLGGKGLLSLAEVEVFGQ